MLAIFSLRLACGLALALLLVPTAQVNPRFLRAHFWTILGLLVVPAVFPPGERTATWWLLFGASMLAAFCGSLAWSLDRAPGGRWAIVVTALLTLATLMRATGSPTDPGWLHALTENVSSATLLGTSFTAMLIGHSYLLMPTMSLTPLLRLIAVFYVALLARAGLAGFDLWSRTHGFRRFHFESDTMVWLTLRWSLGFALPLFLGWLAWRTAKIRSTQSATGILYVVVIFCFLGELTSQLLFALSDGTTR